ncbi:hypothetical protein RCO27_17360 [Sphingosinicella sp. LHD-64]|uniref:tetratricopeptide repeat protein n=1 Tax=Sphingosinicella sp. LHD-64 TaxID=3072139 RepID=UPI00280DD219|nr:hypothetical protein [Sphingosinicella sp. LHD-64]MDQ8757997.1 hypothetical protein [Sphingosinicella sp. LHD-64]
MIARSLLLIGGSLLVATAANAQTIHVLGTNADAIACFRAAESESPRPEALRPCGEALRNTDLSAHDRIATYVNRGIVNFRTANFDAAIADFDTALDLHPNQPDALINKGITMLAAGSEVNSAVSMIDQGLANRPQRPWVGYWGRAVAHELAGRDAQAYRDYSRARQLRPGWQPAEQALARFSVRGG